MGKNNKKVNVLNDISLIVHRLQTPIAAIAWYAEMLLTENIANITDSQKEYIEKIISSNRNMLSLVNDLSKVSEYEDPGATFEFVNLDVIQIVNRSIYELEAFIKSKSLIIKKDYEDSLMIQSSMELLTVIFENLLSNAVKYSDNNSEIRVDLKLLDSKLHITVVDDGIGIPQEDQDKLFDKLFRASNAKKTDIAGTGLGLYIVKNSVDRLKGEIEIDSKEGGGCTVNVVIPAMDKS